MYKAVIRFSDGPIFEMGVDCDRADVESIKSKAIDLANAAFEKLGVHFDESGFVFRDSPSLSIAHLPDLNQKTICVLSCRIVFGDYQPGTLTTVRTDIVRYQGWIRTIEDNTSL